MLALWCPLNGNLKNQGLDSVTTSSTGAYTTGKVTSKCFNHSTYAQWYVPSLVSCKEFSVSYWLKVSSNLTTDWNSHVKLLDGTSHIRFEACGGTYKHIVGVYNNTGYKMFTSQLGTSITTKDVWVHVAYVYSYSQLKHSLYINGNLIESKALGTVNNSSALTGYVQCGFTTNMFINDLRVYTNELLSIKQIKELSKGLALHYKLSRGGENLLTNSIGEFSGTNTSTTNYKDFKSWSAVITPEVNSYYTVSFDAKGSLEANDRLVNYLYNDSSGRQVEKSSLYVDGYLYSSGTSGNGAMNIPLSTVYKHFVIVRKFNSNATALTKSLLFRIYKGSEYTVTIKNVKLEKGSVSTSWIPNKLDTLYSKLGYNSIEPDCSGYGNDGTITGSLIYSNETPRYEGSSYFDYAYNVKGNFSLSSLITISFWAKVSQFDTSGWVVLAGQSTGYYLDADSSSNTNWHSKATVSKYYRDGILVASSNTMAQFISRDGNWHNYVYVCTLTDWTKMTVNGGSLWGISWRAKVNISDFRIYATELSAADIKALYYTPISIDNNHNLHCMEVVE